jgi:hypothetical protein
MIPFILLSGAPQRCGAAMNGQFNKYVVKPCLVSAVPFELFSSSPGITRSSALIAPQKDSAVLP